MIVKRLFQRLWPFPANSATRALRPTNRVRRIRIEPLEDRRLLATYGVLNTNNSGPGSLRQAIVDANAGPSADTIRFSIPVTDTNFVDVDSSLPSGDTAPDSYVIRLLSGLPTLTGTTIIDGRTQTSFGGDSNPFGPEIVIDGNSVNANALSIQGDNSAVYALNIQRSGSYGLFVYGATNAIVAGNYIGTDATGTSARGNASGGLYVHAERVTIGGSSLANRNVISGNDGSGIQIFSSTSTLPGAVVIGNLIGTDATGTFAIGNNENGVWLTGRASNNRIGRSGFNDDTEANVISGNYLDGIRISDGQYADNNRIAGNYIGTNAAGATTLGNLGAGVRVDAFASGNIIGGNSVSLRNTIAFNAGSGVVVEDYFADETEIRGNSIHHNGGLGIDLGDDGVTPNDHGDRDFGPNNGQNFPVLYSTPISGTTLTVTGSLNGFWEGAHTIEFFANSEADPSGHGEGEVFLGTTTVTIIGSGSATFSWSFTGDFTTRRVITATAIDPFGSTSEFSSSPIRTFLDNGDEGFTAPGEWVEHSLNSIARDGDFHYAQDHGGNDVAAWTFDVQPGQYRVAATWVANPHFSQQAPFTVLDAESPRGNTRLNQQAAPDTFNDDGSPWEDFGGVYNIVGSTLRVELTAQGTDGRYVMADAIRVQRIGNLPVAPVAQVFEGNREIPDVGGSVVDYGHVEFNHPLTKTFTVINTGLQPLDIIAFSLFESAGFTLVAPGALRLDSGQSTTFDVRLDAQLPGIYSGYIGFYDSDGTGDAFVFKVTATVLPIVDDGGPGFTVTNTWGTAASGLGYGGGYRYSRDTTGADVATWTFDVTPGQYRVAATWFGGSQYFDDTAPFTVFDGAAVRGGRDLNQQLPPDDGNVGDLSFEEIGVFNILGNTLSVQLRGDDPLLFVLADAVMVERLGDVPAGPEIAVFDGHRDVTPGGVSFGTVEPNQFPDKTFTIANSGAGVLDLTGPISVPAGYALLTPPAVTSLNPGETTTFVVRLDATQPGDYGGEIIVPNNDDDEAALSFAVFGTLLIAQTLDNGEPGYSQTGGFQTAQLATAHDGDMAYAIGGAAASEATWTFTVTPGQYLIAAKWFDTAGNTLFADNAPFTILDGLSPVANVLVNQRFQPDDFADLDGNWEFVGGTTNLAGTTLTVRLTSAGANGYVLADAIRVERVGDLPAAAEVEVSQDQTHIVDEAGSVDYGIVELNRPLDKTFTISNVGQQPLTITAGSFVLPPGFSLVSPPASTPLNSGQSTTFVVRLNADVPGDYAGQITFATNDSDEGTFNFNVSGRVLATRILDNGETGYIQTGDFQTAAVSIARDRDVGYVHYQAAPSGALWTFTVTPGYYRIAATWFDTAGITAFATNAPFTILDNGAPRADVLVNQRIAPNDFSEAGSSWEFLGDEITISGTALTVRLTNAGANGYVLADAIRIERIEPPTADIVDVSPDPRNMTVESVTIRFSEDVTGVDPGDYSLTLDGSPIDPSTWSLAAISGSEYQIDVSSLSAEGDYVLTLRADGSSIADLAGSLFRNDATDSWTIDTTPATARFSGFINNPREVPLNQLAVVFTEEVIGFGSQHLRLTRDGQPVDISTMTITQVSPVGYQLRLGDVPQEANGQYVLTFDPTALPITDLANNLVTTGFSTEWLKLPVTVPITDVEDYVLHGVAEDDQFGISVAGAGDVNGDGLDDVVIGARSADSTGGSDTGAAFLIFGDANRDFNLDVASLDGLRGVVLDGTSTGDNFSWSVASAGDFDADGLDDLVIGASLASPDGMHAAGEAYLIYGRRVWPARIDVSAMNATDGFTLQGLNPQEGLGTAVAGDGDANGDGYSDIMIGAPGTRFGENRAGAAYLIFGGPRGGPPLDLANLSGADGVQLQGQNFGDAAGQAVAFASDVNRDGLDDLLIGAPYANPNTQNNAGTTYVVFGTPDWPATLSLVGLDGASGAAMHGIGLGVEDNAGYSVDSAGDVNGDGYQDIVIGAPQASSNGDIEGGRTFVVFGAASWPAELELGSLDGANGFVLNGVRYFNESGHSAGPAGDIDGDGLDDLVIGAPGAFRPEHRGGAYVVFGRQEWPDTIHLVTLDGGNGFAIATANEFDFFGNSVDLIGDVDGDGLSDIVVGAPAASRWTGESYIVVGADFRDHVTELGTMLDDHWSGSIESERLLGAQGNDLLEGGGGADVLYGGQGDDTLAIVDLLFARLAGANGEDTLRFDAAEMDLDLTAIPDTRITGIERIDLGGVGANRLTLTRRELLRLSDESNTLVVDGGADDSVTVLDGLWTDEGVADGYRIYSLGQARLKISLAIGSVNMST